MNDDSQTIPSTPSNEPPPEAQPAAPVGAVPPAADKPAPRKNKLSKTLPTDRINLPKQFEIIVVYSIAYDKSGGQAVTNAEIASLVGLAGTTVAMMNAFITDVGIVVKTDNGKYVPSGETQECARMFQINPLRAWSKLSALMERSWFGEELVAKLRLRSLSENEALEDLAEIAHAEKDHLPQLKVALDYLEKTGVLVREGGQLKLASPPPQDSEEQRPEIEAVKGKKNSDGLNDEDEELERHSLTLDPKTKRKIVILTPPAITKRELERVQAWLSFQLIVTNPESNTT